MPRKISYICYVRNFALFVIFLAASLFAADSLSGDWVNFPLPRQGAYTGKGLSVGLAAGVFDPTKECDCLGVWQAQGEYYYYPWMSGSVDVRFFGGNLDSDVMVMYQRYRLSAKFFMVGDVFALYLSPVLGLENTSLSEFRDELTGFVYDENRFRGAEKDSLEERNSCEKMFSLGGFTMGMEMGGGIALGKYFGITGSLQYEYSFSEAQQLTLTPGLAFNLREIWGWSQKKLRSTWISVEMGFQRYFNRGVNSWAKSAVLGIQMGI